MFSRKYFIKYIPVDASIGENDDTLSGWDFIELPVVATAADKNVAILTLPNGANPAGWTALFSSFKYDAVDWPTCTSYENCW